MGTTEQFKATTALMHSVQTFDPGRIEAMLDDPEWNDTLSRVFPHRDLYGMTYRDMLTRLLVLPHNRVVLTLDRNKYKTCSGNKEEYGLTWSTIDWDHTIAYWKLLDPEHDLDEQFQDYMMYLVPERALVGSFSTDVRNEMRPDNKMEVIFDAPYISAMLYLMEQASLDSPRICMLADPCFLNRQVECISESYYLDGYVQRNVSSKTSRHHAVDVLLPGITCPSLDVWQEDKYCKDAPFDLRATLRALEQEVYDVAKLLVEEASFGDLPENISGPLHMEIAKGVCSFTNERGTVLDATKLLLESLIDHVLSELTMATAFVTVSETGDCVHPSYELINDGTDVGFSNLVYDENGEYIQSLLEESKFLPCFRCIVSCVSGTNPDNWDSKANEPRVWARLVKERLRLPKLEPKMLGLEPTETYNERYCKPYEMDGSQLLVIQSNCGTGKTVQDIELIRKVMTPECDHFVDAFTGITHQVDPSHILDTQSRTRILYIGPRRTLDREFHSKLSNAMKSWNLDPSIAAEYYIDMDPDDMNNGKVRSSQELQKANILVIQIDSLWRLNDRPKYDVVIVDEINAVMRQCVHSDQSIKNYDALLNILTVSAKVVLQDAFAGERVAKLLGQIQRDDVKVIRNTFQPWGKYTYTNPETGVVDRQKRVQCHFHYAETWKSEEDKNAISPVEQEIIKAVVIRKERVAIASTSVRLASTITERLKRAAEFNKVHMRPLVILGDEATMSKDEQTIKAQFLNDSDEVVSEHDVWIYSPSVTVGTDVTVPHDHVFAFVRHTSISAEEVVQQLCRIRFNTSRRVDVIVLGRDIENPRRNLTTGLDNLLQPRASIETCFERFKEQHMTLQGQTQIDQHLSSDHLLKHLYSQVNGNTKLLHSHPVTWLTLSVQAETSNQKYDMIEEIMKLVMYLGGRVYIHEDPRMYMSPEEEKHELKIRKRELKKPSKIQKMTGAVSTTGDKLSEIDNVVKLALASYDNPDATEQMTDKRQEIINTYILSDSFVERHIAEAAAAVQNALDDLLTCVKDIPDLAQPMGSIRHLEQEDFDKVVAKRGSLKEEYSSFWLTEYNCEKAFRQYNALSMLCSNCIDESKMPAPTDDLARLPILHEERGGYLDMDRVLQMAQQQMNVGVGLVPAAIECLRHLGFSDIINDIVPLEGCRWDLVATTLINVIKKQTTKVAKEITSNQRTVAFLERFLTSVRAGRTDVNTYDKDIHNCLSRRILEPAFSAHIAKCRPDRRYDNKHTERNTHIELWNSMWYYELGGFNCHPDMPKVNVIAKRPSDANAQERAMLAEMIDPQ
jgi:hypothetical protein